MENKATLDEVMKSFDDLSAKELKAHGLAEPAKIFLGEIMAFDWGSYTYPSYSVVKDGKILAGQVYGSLDGAAECIANAMKKNKLSTYKIFNGSGMKYYSDKIEPCLYLPWDVVTSFVSALEKKLGAHGDEQKYTSIEEKYEQIQQKMQSE